MPEGIKRGHTDRQIDRKVGRDGERKKEIGAINFTDSFPFSLSWVILFPTFTGLSAAHSTNSIQYVVYCGGSPGHNSMTMYL